MVSLYSTPAATETGFGPFLSVYLTQLRWSQEDVGLALSIGTIAGLVAQLPAGALVDGIHAKRLAAAGALLVTIAGIAVCTPAWRG
jgi:MFS family permease